MDKISNTSTPERPALVPDGWVALLVAAVVLAEAIWGLLLSLTNNFFLPLMAKVIGGDLQSPLYLGKRDLNIPALFSSVLELCLAVIVFVLLHHWSRRRPVSVRVKTVRMGKTVSQATAQPLSITPFPAPSVAPTQASVSPPAVPVSNQSSAPSTPTRAPVQPQTTPTTSPPAPRKPAKPKPAKEVYYNIVGEPINPAEDK
jgi:hypothetical protein